MPQRRQLRLAPWQCEGWSLVARRLVAGTISSRISHGELFFFSLLAEEEDDDEDDTDDDGNASSPL